MSPILTFPHRTAPVPLRAGRMAACALLLLLALPVLAQERPLVATTVTKLQGIRIVPGHMTDYQNYLGRDWRTEQQALKDAGVIVDYYVMQDQANGRDKADLYLVQVLPDMAALDRFEKGGASSVFGAMKSDYTKDGRGMQDRNASRSVVNVKLLRNYRFRGQR